MELYSAHSQWSSRPADERFRTLNDLHGNVAARDNASRDGHIDLTQCNLTIAGARAAQDILLVGKTSQAKLTNWSANQLAQRLGVPLVLLPKLEPTVAQAVLNDRLPKAIADGSLNRRQRVLIADGTLRAFHSDRYERLWDKQVTQTLLEYLPRGWRNPVAFEGGKWGASLVPSGLYAGDRDMFAFFVDGGDWTDKPVGTFDVDGDGFNRGFFVWNSEVGAKTFGWTSFMFRVVCGNNIVWGAKDATVTRARHIGNANDTLRGFRRFLEVLNEQPSPDLFAQAVREAKATIVCSISAKRDETLELAFASKLKSKFTQTDIALALDKGIVEAEQERRPVDGSRWFWLQGLTAVARGKDNADDKAKLEQDASDLLLAVKR